VFGKPRGLRAFCLPNRWKEVLLLHWAMLCVGCFLAYLPGAAVTHVKIEGVLHEFSPLPGVKEDVLDFLLNVKALHLRPVSGRAGKLILDVSGEREVYARDISPSNDFVIVNPDLYLATIDSSEARLYAEFDVDIGIGYQPAGSAAKLPVGTIPVDAVFAPVRKVNLMPSQ